MYHYDLMRRTKIALLYTLGVGKAILFAGSTLILALSLQESHYDLTRGLFGLLYLGTWWIPGLVYYYLFVKWGLFEEKTAVVILFVDLFLTLLFGMSLVLLSQVFSRIAFAWSCLSFVGFVFASAVSAVPELKRPVMLLGILQLGLGFTLNFLKISLGLTLHESEALRTILTSTGAITTLAGMGRQFDR